MNDVDRIRTERLAESAADREAMREALADAIGMLDSVSFSGGGMGSAAGNKMFKKVILRGRVALANDLEARYGDRITEPDYLEMRMGHE